MLQPRGTSATRPAVPSFLWPPQVVEQELRRIPAHVARRYTQQLWSITYIPQVHCTAAAGGAGAGWGWGGSQGLLPHATHLFGGSMHGL